jgi:hypothetical protein
MEVTARNRAALAVAVILALLAALVAVAVAGARSAGAAPKEPVEVKLLGSGSLLDDGATAEVRARIRCEPTPPVLEALVTSSQEPNVGFGEGFFVGLVTCDGQPHVQTARIQTFDEERFQRGKAFVSAFVLLCDEESGECFSGQDTRLVQLR